MEGAIRGACNAATTLLDEYAPVEIVYERYSEKHPHPGGQEAFSVRARFPWHRQPHTRVMVEIPMDEQVLKPTPSRTILHEYGEPLTATVKQMDFAAFAPFVAAKCAVRQVTFMDAEDFFQPAMLAHVQSTWNQWLEPLVPDLPPFETVVGSLRPQIAQLLSREDR